MCRNPAENSRPSRSSLPSALTHSRTHTHIYAYVQTRINYTHTHIHTHAYTRTHIEIHMQSHIHMHMHPHMLIFSAARTYEAKIEARSHATTQRGKYTGDWSEVEAQTALSASESNGCCYCRCACPTAGPSLTAAPSVPPQTGE